ncbi:MAG: heme exporter protein CcmD [Caulobacteraceae bacterium]
MSHLPLPNLDVGKYAAFVWPAYGLSALALLAMLGDSLLRTRRWRREAEAGAPDASGRDAS